MISFETWNSSIPNRSLLTDEFEITADDLGSLNDDLFSLNNDDIDFPSLIISQDGSDPSDLLEEDSILPTPIGGNFKIVDSFGDVPLNGSLLSNCSKLSSMLQALKDSSVTDSFEMSKPSQVTSSISLFEACFSHGTEEADFGSGAFECMETDVLNTPVMHLSRPVSPDLSEDSSRFQQSSRWNQRFHELVQYKEDHGHCNVPYLWPKNRPLSEWVKRQRHQYKLKVEGRRSALTDKRQGMLTAVGFVWNSRESLWDNRYQELLVHYQTFGHVRVSKKTPQYRALSVWLKRQRHACRVFLAGDKSTCMTQDRLSKLTDLGVKIVLDR